MADARPPCAGPGKGPRCLQRNQGAWEQAYGHDMCGECTTALERFDKGEVWMTSCAQCRKAVPADVARARCRTCPRIVCAACLQFAGMSLFLSDCGWCKSDQATTFVNKIKQDRQRLDRLYQLQDQGTAFTAPSLEAALQLAQGKHPDLEVDINRISVLGETRLERPIPAQGPEARVAVEGAGGAGGGAVRELVLLPGLHQAAAAGGAGGGNAASRASSVAAGGVAEGEHGEEARRERMRLLEKLTHDGQREEMGSPRARGTLATSRGREGEDGEDEESKSKDTTHKLFETNKFTRESSLAMDDGLRLSTEIVKFRLAMGLPVEGALETAVYNVLAAQIESKQRKLVERSRAPLVDQLPKKKKMIKYLQMVGKIFEQKGMVSKATSYVQLASLLEVWSAVTDGSEFLATRLIGVSEMLGNPPRGIDIKSVETFKEVSFVQRADQQGKMVLDAAAAAAGTRAGAAGGRGRGLAGDLGGGVTGKRKEAEQGDRRCFRCQSTGHRLAECPQTGRGGRPRGPRPRPQVQQTTSFGGYNPGWSAAPPMPPWMAPGAVNVTPQWQAAAAYPQQQGPGFPQPWSGGGAPGRYGDGLNTGGGMRPTWRGGRGEGRGGMRPRS